jgi:type II secretory pathway component PulM
VGLTGVGVKTGSLGIGATVVARTGAGKVQVALAVGGIGAVEVWLARVGEAVTVSVAVGSVAVSVGEADGPAVRLGEGESEGVSC